jgi:hypothetical protein
VEGVIFILDVLIRWINAKKSQVLTIKAELIQVRAAQIILSHVSYMTNSCTNQDDCFGAAVRVRITGQTVYLGSAFCHDYILPHGKHHLWDILHKLDLPWQR